MDEDELGRVPFDRYPGSTVVSKRPGLYEL
jgi:hypothetical protein